MTFQKIDTLYYTISNSSNDKIAFFDLDGTIIKVKSDNKFSVDENDWDFLYDNTIKTLNKLYNDKYQIVIITNQKGVSKGSITIDSITKKINNVIKKLSFPIDVLIATEDDYYRKPNTGMFDFYNKYVKVDTNNSFFCGDAAGRVFNSKTKDFNITDKFFAYNCGLKFYTPEELFNQPIQKYKINDPYNDIELDLSKYEKGDYNNYIIKKQNQQMIILVGKPASGKTTFTKKYYNDYVHINQDTLKTKQKCVSKARDSIKSGQNIIIDNTNGLYETRKLYYDLIGNLNIQVIIYIFDIPYYLSYHLNNLRVQQTKGLTKKIPSIVYTMYMKKYKEPTNDEYKNLQIIKLPFIIDDNIDTKQFYYKFDI